MVDRYIEYSTLDTTKRDERFSALVALLCGHGVAFPGVRSLGHVRFELVSSRDVRLHVSPHFPTPYFSLQPSAFSFDNSDAPQRSKPVFNTSGFMYLPGIHGRSDKISLPTRSPSVCRSGYI